MSEVVGTSWGAYTSGVYEWCWWRVGTHGTVMIIMSGTVYLVLVMGWWDKSFSTVMYQNHDDLSSTIIPMWYNNENWKPERLLMAQVYKSRDMAATQTPSDSRAEVWASRLYWKVLSILHKISFWRPLFSGASLGPSRSSCKLLVPQNTSTLTRIAAGSIRTITTFLFITGSNIAGAKFHFVWVF